MDVSKEYRYNRLTWAEMNEAISIQKVVIMPQDRQSNMGSICLSIQMSYLQNRFVLK